MIARLLGLVKAFILSFFRSTPAKVLQAVVVQSAIAVKAHTRLRGTVKVSSYVRSKI